MFFVVKISWTKQANSTQHMKKNKLVISQILYTLYVFWIPSNMTHRDNIMIQ